MDSMYKKRSIYDENAITNLNSKPLDILFIYLKDISHYKLLTPEEEKELFKRYNQGDIEVKNTIIKSNLRLVVSIAKKNLNRGLPFLDLIQEGSIGLMKSMKNFDVNKGYKFSVYATWSIKKNIELAIADQSRVLNLSHRDYDEINRLLKTEAIFKQENKRNPTYEELAHILGFSVKKVVNLFNINQLTLNLDMQIGEEETILGDFVSNNNAITPETYLNDKMTKEYLNQMFKILNPREEKILKLRYGFIDNREWTLKEIANELNITSERVRQIEKAALKKIRNSIKMDLYSLLPSDEGYDVSLNIKL